jgi:hypothetical protein
VVCCRDHAARHDTILLGVQHHELPDWGVQHGERPREQYTQSNALAFIQLAGLQLRRVIVPFAIDLD